MFLSFFLNFQTKSQVVDTLNLQQKDTIEIDTLAKVKKNQNALEAPVDYSANDSIIFSMDGKKAYLYGQGIVKYQDIKLQADYIELDMENDIVFAIGVKDSIGKLKGKPIFTEGEEEFESVEMRYNFKTKEGIVKGVISKQDEGFMHSEKTKIHANKHIHIKNGKYTTCDHEHPHFYIKMTKAKIIPNDKIVSGFSYLVIADVPTPICLPFGFFPNSKGRASGLIIPSYYDNNYGFGLKDGGWYWAINDYMDLKLTTEIATQGSWKLNPELNYKKRYAFNGFLNIDYGKLKKGDEKDNINYVNKKSFWIEWRHKQDPKFRPNSTFTADVKLGSSSYQQENSLNSSNRLRNEWNSSVNYTWNKSPFSVSVNLKHTQNQNTGKVDMTLPQINFNVNSFRPFQKSGGKKTWYEGFSISYSSDFLAKTEIADSLFLSSDLFFKQAFSHKVPISMPITLIKNLKLTPNFTYTGVAVSGQTFIYEDEKGHLKNERKEGIAYADAFTSSISLSYAPKIYGMYQFTPKFIRKKIEAIRHLVTPSFTLSYTPDFVGDDYRNRFQDEFVFSEDTMTYKFFERELKQAPTYSRESGRINFSLSNNLEMKVKSEKDTLTGTKKIVLIDNLSISTAYDMLKDSLNFSKINLSANTQLFKKLNIRFNANFDPYIYKSFYETVSNSIGEDSIVFDDNIRINKFEWTENNRLAHFDNTTWKFDISYDFTPDMFKQTDENEEEKELTEIKKYDYFKVPWTLNISYSFSNSVTYNYNQWTFYGKQEKNVIQSLTTQGSIDLTDKWAISFRGDYNFDLDKVTNVDFRIARNLHCWEMSFHWVPLGLYKTYEFRINATGALSDLKKEIRRTFRDRNN